MLKTGRVTLDYYVNYCDALGLAIIALYERAGASVTLTSQFFEESGWVAELEIKVNHVNVGLVEEILAPLV
jgi:hypothetical protein